MDLRKLLDPELMKKHQIIIETTMERLGIAKGSTEPRDIAKVELTQRFNDFLLNIGVFCMIHEISTAETWEILRANIDASELAIKISKEYLEGK